MLSQASATLPPWWNEGHNFLERPSVHGRHKRVKIADYRETGG